MCWQQPIGKPLLVFRVFTYSLDGERVFGIVPLSVSMVNLKKQDNKVNKYWEIRGIIIIIIIIRGRREERGKKSRSPLMSGRRGNWPDSRFKSFKKYITYWCERQEVMLRSRALQDTMAGKDSQYYWKSWTSDWLARRIISLAACRVLQNTQVWLVVPITTPFIGQLIVPSCCTEVLGEGKPTTFHIHSVYDL